MCVWNKRCATNDAGVTGRRGWGRGGTFCSIDLSSEGWMGNGRCSADDEEDDGVEVDAMFVFTRRITSSVPCTCPGPCPNTGPNTGPGPGLDPVPVPVPPTRKENP